MSQSACGTPLEVGSVVYHDWSPVPPVWNRMSSTSASGTTENSTESWWPWYDPSILMILSRPVAARATRIASIVASVPEFTNRICSSWKRSQIASASAIVSGVVTAKWIALLAALVERLDDLGVGVADDVDAEATVEVLVLLAVDVPDARALPLLEVDRVGVAHLEVRGDTPGAGS